MRGSRRERLLSKFVENEYEKIDRLMELYMRSLLQNIYLYGHPIDVLLNFDYLHFF